MARSCLRMAVCTVVKWLQFHDDALQLTRTYNVLFLYKLDNRKNQFAACSGDQLNLIPATGTGVIIRVVEVTLINAVAGPYTGAFSHEAVAALPPGSDYDFSNGCRAIYCFLGSCSEHGICC